MFLLHKKIASCELCETKFLQIVDIHAPIRTKRVRSKSCPWITAGLKERMHNRDTLKIKAIKSNDPHDWANFKRMRNKVNTEIKAAKKVFYNNKFIENNGDPRKTWQTINDLTSRKAVHSSIREINLKGTFITESSDLSNAFNDHFSSIGSTLANDIPLSDDNDHCHREYVKGINNRFEFHPTDSGQVLKLLNKLNKSKGSGLDKLSSRLIRECADLISPYISTIFNCCLTTGIFPDDWKLAKVTPIFKQGDRSDMNNYRPISVISAIAKVFERIIYNQLSSYLSENNILSQYQSGFRSFHSTMTALLEATDDWAFNIDRGYVNAVVFLDLKKAFDTVDHPILLSKLYLYGVIGNAYELLSSYLDNRTQRCAVNGVISNTCTLTCGIPQGTILGPLLFLLYTNDLPNCLSNSKPRMYADDTHLTYADNDICSIETSLNQDLSNINRWLIANKLTLNMTKTEFMLIGSRQKLNSLSAFPVLEINGTQLNRVNFTKSLGVLIDENLTWSNHINAITKKISSGIGSIKRISHCVPPATLHTIYHGLVQSHFDYCSVVWGNCAKTLSDKLQRLQNRAVRVLTNTCYDADANQLLNELGWENLETRRQKLKAEMVYKSLNGLAPNYLSSRFIQRSDVITAYNLRDSDGKLAIPLPRTNYYKNSFGYSGAVLWNSLPSAARQATSLTSFRQLLTNYDTAFM